MGRKTNQQQSCLLTTREQLSSAGRKVCKQSAGKRHHQRLVKPHCHQSSTTDHQWSSYSMLAIQNQENNMQLHRVITQCMLRIWQWHYLYSDLHACFHGDYKQHTCHTGSHLGFFQGHMAASKGTSGQVNSSCSGFSWQHEVPYPCPSGGTWPCSASWPSGPPPEKLPNMNQDLLDDFSLYKQSCDRMLL